jgi:hypothetical protein
MRKKIEDAFAVRFPTAKRHQISKAVDKYVDEVVKALAKSIVSHGYQNGDEISLAVFDLRTEVGRMTVNGKQEWILPLMASFPDTALYTIGKKGNEGMVSRVSLNPRYEQQIMQELINLNLELSVRQINEMRANATNWAPYDPDSLQAYITKTGITYAEVEQKNDPSKRVYRDALARNLLIAMQLKEQGIYDNGGYFLPEVYWTDDSGRMYGKGLSLQRVPKVVRHAALGVCDSYDFKASCYALMTGLALQIDPTLKVAALTEYITHRETIRKNIAKSIGITEKKAKGIFSSLGFGAKLSNNPYNTIASELGPERYELLTANKEFHHISKAFKLVQATILDHYSSSSFTFMGLQYDNVDPKSDPLTPKKRNRNQKLAWIYQAMESTAIAQFAAMAVELGYNPMLFAHDCVYFKHQIPTSYFHSIISELRREFPLLQVEREAITPIHDGTGPVQDAFDRYEDMIDSHKAFVDSEELLSDPAFVKLPDDLSQTLNPVSGYFKSEIMALNTPDGNSGKSINLGH